jgi:hypothetical protein
MGVCFVITVPSDGEGPYGTVSATPMLGVAFINVGGGIYTINHRQTQIMSSSLCDSDLSSGNGEEMLDCPYQQALLYQVDEVKLHEYSGGLMNGESLKNREKTKLWDTNAKFRKPARA